MAKFGEFIQTAEWKTEKHVPVIELPEEVKKDQSFIVKVIVGKEIEHPNTTEHHIKWIELYFKPEGEKFMYLLGKTDFSAHGASAKGANEGPCYTNPQAVFDVKVSKPGTLIALEHCNIHGVWEGVAELKFTG